MDYFSRHVFEDYLIVAQKAQSFAQCAPVVDFVRSSSTAWAQMSVDMRTKQLEQFAHRLTGHRDTLAHAICIEVGRCLRECYAEVDKSIALVRYYAESAQNWLAPQTVATGATLSQVIFEPLGVVLAVMPWNYPVWQILRFAIPALCAGNGCVIKPAPSVLNVTRKLFDLMDDLPCRAVFLDHRDIESLIAYCDALAFTGSAQTGSYLASLAGKHLKKCVLELGGSNALLVLDDADIHQAAKEACYARFRDAGQSCNAAKRIIVTERVADEFLDCFLAQVRALRSGDPMDEATGLALLHLEGAPRQMQDFVDDALNRGAHCLTGGTLPCEQSMYPATVLDHVSRTMRVAQEEVFGPVAAIFRVHDAQEAIEVANDSPYGLGAGIYSQNVAQAWEIAKQIHTGSVFINRHCSSDLHLPFGGVKKSGFGRELSQFGLYEFINIKSYWQK